MSSNEPGTILMIELLSLEHKQAGYQIEVGLTRNSGYARCLVNIDEYTYEQLSLLGPFTQERMRLSLYPKWDPFRKSYYSTLIKMNKTFSETLYFACSEYYVSQLLQLKQQDTPPSDDERKEPAVFPSVEVKHPKDRTKAKRRRQITLRYIMLACLVCILILRMDGQFIESAEALEEPVQQLSSDNHLFTQVVPLVRTVSLIQNEHLEPSPEPPEPQVEQNPLYDEIEIEDEQFVYSLPKGYVALSFDDGPSKYTKEIVDILVEHKVAATFLFVGNKVSGNPEAVSYANQHEMSIGSHSWDHSNMTDNEDGENYNNLLKANQALEQITHSPITVFRPPYGSINDKLAAKVSEQQMKVLLWNRDPEDWNVKSPEDILHYVYNADPSGGVYLFHEKKITVEALPEIIKYFQAKNMKFVIFK